MSVSSESPWPAIISTVFPHPYETISIASWRVAWRTRMSFILWSGKNLCWEEFAINWVYHTTHEFFIIVWVQTWWILSWSKLWRRAPPAFSTVSGRYWEKSTIIFAPDIRITVLLVSCSCLRSPLISPAFEWEIIWTSIFVFDKVFSIFLDWRATIFWMSGEKSDPFPISTNLLCHATAMWSSFFIRKLYHIIRTL